MPKNWSVFLTFNRIPDPNSDADFGRIRSVLEDFFRTFPRLDFKEGSYSFGGEKYYIDNRGHVISLSRNGLIANFNTGPALVGSRPIAGSLPLKINPLENLRGKLDEKRQQLPENGYNLIVCYADRFTYGCFKDVLYGLPTLKIGNGLFCRNDGLFSNRSWRRISAIIAVKLDFFGFVTFDKIRWGFPVFKPPYCELFVNRSAELKLSPSEILFLKTAFNIIH